METASHQYKAKADNAKLRAAQRNKTVAVTLLSLAEMTPEQDGLSVLRGGLNSIFKLLKRRVENGERILAAFEDIPIAFPEAVHAQRAHPMDEQLRGFIKNLYSTLREEIPKLTTILLRQRKGSLLRRLLKQHPETEASSIDSSLETITRASHRVTTRVSILANQVMADDPCFVVVSYFCSLHSTPRNPMSGCRGMLRNLIEQLLFHQRRMYGNKALLLTEMFLDDIARLELSALCKLFELILTTSRHPLQSIASLTTYANSKRNRKAGRRKFARLSVSYRP
ncbi:hypothetical protein QQZ08_005524 [Neonectria magnoliae]|uniref:Uncharacterized protein n=1 Tax=Neonectria magnoliae TaxID=2732573 RepID=A0ABR1I4N9_9HYPO